MTDFFKIPKENGLSHYDGQSVLRDVHNEKNKALETLTVNHLVPERFSRVEIDYFLTGPYSGEIQTARYYSDGEKETTLINCLADVLGSPHKTSLLYSGANYNSFAKTYFVINDSAGTVGIFYKLDGIGTPPVNLNRVIVVELVTGDTTAICIAKTAAVINADSEFTAIYSSEVLIISCTQFGLKPASYNVNSPIFLTNTNGAVPARLNGKWFYINSTGDAQQYYLYFNVAGGGIDPLISGKIGLPVNLPEGASAIAVASQIKSVLESTDKFIVEQFENELLIRNKTVGIVTEANANNTGFSFEIRQKGTNRVLVATLNMTYNDNKDIVSVERE